MGFDDKILGELTKKFGIGAGQAKSALDQILPFVKGKLPSLPGLPGLPGQGSVGLLSKIKRLDLTHPDVQARGKALLDHVDDAEKEAHVQEVAKGTGLDAATVREMLPMIAGAHDLDDK